MELDRNGNVYFRGGNVGIGHQDPQAKLHVQGADGTVRFEASAIGFESLSDTMPGMEMVIGGMNAGASQYGYGLKFMSDDPAFTTENPKLLAAIIPRARQSYNDDADGGMALDFATTPNNPGPSSAPTVRMTIDNDGKVGIGTTEPEQPLDVKGDFVLGGQADGFDGTLEGFTIRGQSARWTVGVQNETAAADSGFFIGTTGTDEETFHITRDGNVGIGTEPDANNKLHVRTSGVLARAIFGEASSVNTGVEGWHTALTGDGWGVVGRTSSPQGIGVFGGATGGGRAGFFQGNVVVRGTTTTDILQITGADLAEKFPVSEEVKPGMVVGIDPDHPGQLHVARGMYNRRVAGVVSGANGLSVGVVLGNLPGKEDAPPIAMSGRVYVLADASNGPIQPGDLLTTSDTPGHAMKVTDYAKAQGAIIGKAMTPLKDGKGLVLVLVSLQ